VAGNKSDTTMFCTCGWLERAAEEPSSPIGFDERLNEYHLVHGRFYSIFRFCPFCGCKAPKSRRESLFEVVPEAEMERLQNLVKGIKTLDDARRVLGEPDDVLEPGGSSGTTESEAEPPGVTFYGRMFRWLHVSTSAEVFVQVPALAEVSVGITPKPKRDASDPPKGNSGRHER
jgi:hypothetical protein